MKYCCFRFDVDTHVCVAKGVPRLAALAGSLGVPFTFFINMGRSFSPWITLGKTLRRSPDRERRGSLPAMRKLGLAASLHAALLNPKVGAYAPAALRAAANDGHELGLHGGRNHARWERFAHTWSKAQIDREVRSGLRAMAACGLPAPRAFASPAWNSPAALPGVLAASGFQVLADTLGSAHQNITALGTMLAIPTNITSELTSTGFFEAAHLQGWTGPRLINEFRWRLRAQPKLAVVYDHPFFAGVHALERVGDLVRVAQDEGFCLSTLSAAAQALGAELSPAAAAASR